MTPWLGISFILATLTGLITMLGWYQQRYAPHPELVRKVLHICMGLTTLTLPWLFDEIWPVLVLAGITVPGLLLLRHSGRLKCRAGGVINGVNRSGSLGEIYFPLGVAGLFMLSGGDMLRYTIPILLLALADAAAALIGAYYGRLRYTTLEGYKSVEGSLAFFGVAFLSAYLPLLVLSDLAPVEGLLIALILGLVMVMVEAIAWHGLDNLLIPIFGFLLLDTFLNMTAFELAGQLALTITLIVFVLLWRKWANLHDNALLGAALVGYLSWSLADWRWFVGPLIVFVGHIVLVSGIGRPDAMLAVLGGISSSQPAAKLGKLGPDQEAENLYPPTQPYNIYAVISVASGGLLWLFLFRVLDRPELLYPFTLTFAVQLAVLLLVARKHGGRRAAYRLVLESIVTGWLLLFVPFVLMAGVTGPAIKISFMALFGVGLATTVFYYGQPVLNYYPTDQLRWLRQAGCGILGSLVGIISLYFIY